MNQQHPLLLLFVHIYIPSYSTLEEARPAPQRDDYHPSSTVAFTHSPFAGLDVTPALISMFLSSISALSLSSNCIRPTHAAKRHANSALAKFMPMQLLGPCRNVTLSPR